jgi:hypothetical protein
MEVEYSSKHFHVKKFFIATSDKNEVNLLLMKFWNEELKKKLKGRNVGLLVDRQAIPSF